MDQGSGLYKRGLLLLALMAALAVAVLIVVLGRPEPELPAEGARPERLALLVAIPGGTFPGALSWGALYQLGETLPSLRGWEIRYNATLALARRGSPEVPLDELRDLLDEQRQMRNFRTTLKDGRDVADETAARQTVLSALKAVAEWHKHPEALQKLGPDNPDLQKIYFAIDQLTRSPNRVVQTEAEKTRQALGRG